MTLSLKAWALRSWGLRTMASNPPPNGEDEEREVKRWGWTPTGMARISVAEGFHPSDGYVSVPGHAAAIAERDLEIERLKREVVDATYKHIDAEYQKHLEREARLEAEGERDEARARGDAYKQELADEVGATARAHERIEELADAGEHLQKRAYVEAMAMFRDAWAVLDEAGEGHARTLLEEMPGWGARMREALAAYRSDSPPQGEAVPDLRVCMEHGRLTSDPLFRENCPKCRAAREAESNEP